MEENLDYDEFINHKTKESITKLGLMCNAEEIDKILKEYGKNLTQLQELWLSFNKLETLPKEIGNLTQLQILYLENNKLKILPKEICNLTQLQILYLDNNKLETLPKEIDNLTQLQELYLNNNNLKNLPSQIIQLRQLNYIDISNNPLENLPPNVQRFIHNIQNRQLNNNTVYNDNQNVHNNTVQMSFKESVLNLLNDNIVINKNNYIEDIINDKVLTKQTKQSIIEYTKTDDIYSSINLTFNELLLYIWNRIYNNDDLKQRLNEELSDALCKCFTGRMIRLVNCLVGYYEDITIKINDGEQISAIVINIKNKLVPYDVVEHKRLVKLELLERGYSEDIIQVWLDYIE